MQSSWTFRRPGSSGLRTTSSWLLIIGAVLGPAAGGWAQVALIERFDTGIGANLIGAGYEPATETLYFHRSFQAVIRVLSTDGVQLATLPRPGASGSDFDLDIASEPIDFGGTVVPAGTLLAINGNDTPNRIYALDPVTGAVLASRSIPNSGFGGPFTAVGGSYHPGRDSFFASDYRQDAVREISLATGALLGSFTAGSGFDTFYGDVEVNPTTGNLLLVSDKQRIIRELTPAGQFVQDIDVSAFIGINNNGMSGIAFDAGTGEAWLSIRWGEAVHLGNVSQAVSANLPPICAIAETTPAPCEGAAAVLPLDGSMSMDSDPGESLTFAWTTTCPGGVFDNPAAASPLLTLDTAAGCDLFCAAELTVTDLAGETSTCSAAVAVFDDAPPTLLLETNEIVVLDKYCDGSYEVEMPHGLAADMCDPDPVISNDADALVLSAGQEAVVTYTAADGCGNATAGGPEHQVTITVIPGSTIDLRAYLRVNEGNQRASHQPLAGVEFAAYDRSRDSCARDQRTGKKITDEDFPAIQANCAFEIAGVATTDAEGHALLHVPPGRYVVIGRVEVEGQTHYLGAKIGEVRCGESKGRRLELKLKGPAPHGGSGGNGKKQGPDLGSSHDGNGKNGGGKNGHDKDHDKGDGHGKGQGKDQDKKSNREPKSRGLNLRSR